MGAGASTTHHETGGSINGVKVCYTPGPPPALPSSSPSSPAEGKERDNFFTANITMHDGTITVTDASTSTVVVTINIREENIAISRGLAHETTLATDTKYVVISNADSPQILHWISRLRTEMISSTKSIDEIHKVAQQFQFQELDDDDFDFGVSIKTLPSKLPIVSPIKAPSMSICILVVGTRGDVQPFVYLGQRLQQEGHRVRLATHAEYRADVVAKGGLEFYPLAGDPRKLSEYMVKTGGRLMPDLLNKEEREALPEKMKMLREITFSTHPACTAPDPEDANKRPFLADAIISNPVSYGHIHVAESISVPLHIMFPQPWCPTKAFPHPLSNMGFTSKWSTKNKMSFKMVDEFMWLGLGGMINEFRTSVLGLQPIRVGEHGDQILNDNKVPISHMWSPTFVPKCKDWPDYVDVVGEFKLVQSNQPTSTGTAYQADPRLLDFIASEKPLYIGFGSMVIEKPGALVETIKHAAKAVHCKVLLQSGWTKYAEDYEMISDEVMVIGAMPHDFLFHHVSGVVHHGGAGTTSAGLSAGNPTFICPFFGDQHFWAEMVHRSGCGPPGCPITELTPAKLTTAFEFMKNPSTLSKAQELGALMRAEDGVAGGVLSFYKNLPLGDMICEVCLFDHLDSKLASLFCVECGLKMSLDADRVVHRESGGRSHHQRIPYRPVHLGVVAPTNLLEGLNQGVNVAAYEMAGGLYDLFAKPIEGAAKGGVKGGALGAAEGAKNLFARPMKGGKVLFERLARGARGHVDNEVEANANLSPRADMGGSASVKNLLTGGSVSSKRRQHEEDDPAVVPDDVELLSGPDKAIEAAFHKAKRFQKLWETMDHDGNRTLSAQELAAFVNSKEATDRLLAMADANHSGSLTFAELAWAIVSWNSAGNTEAAQKIDL